MTFAQTPKRRVTRHFTYSRFFMSYKKRGCAISCSCCSCLAARVTTSNNNNVIIKLHVILLCDIYCILFYLPIQKSLKIISNRSSTSTCPVIRANEFTADLNSSTITSTSKRSFLTIIDKWFLVFSNASR